MYLAYKTFEIEEGSTPEHRYQILVRHSGAIVENILCDKMLDARAELARRGYVALPNNSRVTGARIESTF